MNSECVQHIEEFEKNQKWFIDNFREILELYRDKFVAIWNQRVIDYDDILETLSNRVKKNTNNAKGVYLQLVTEKMPEMIL